MRLFKLFFRLAQKYKVYYIISLVYMLVFSLPMKAMVEKESRAEFQDLDVKVSIINHDQGPLATALIDYLDQRVSLVAVEDQAEVKADALFHFKTNYILTIPESWSKNALESHQINVLDKQITSDAKSELYIDTLIFTFIKGLEIQLAGLDPAIPPAELEDTLIQLNQSLDSKVETQVLHQDKGLDRVNNFGSIYTNLIGYVALMTFIAVIGGIHLSTQEPDIVKRDRLGNMSEFARTSQLWLASLTWSILYWLVLILLGLIIFGFDLIMLPQGQLYLLNSLVCVIGIHSLAYFLAILAKNKGVLDFLSVGLSLLLAFFSGIFVPLFLIDPTMQKVVSITTPIWQIKTTELIGSLVKVDRPSTQPIWTNMAIQLGLAIIYFLLSYLIQNYRLKTSKFK